MGNDGHVLDQILGRDSVSSLAGLAINYNINIFGNAWVTRNAIKIILDSHVWRNFQIDLVPDSALAESNNHFRDVSFHLFDHWVLLEPK